MPKRRVVVTGVGMVTSLGNDTTTTWHALLKGESGLANISHFDPSTFPSRIAAEVKHFDVHEFVDDKKLTREAVHFVKYALAAAEQAFDDAGIRVEDDAATRWGCVTGSGMMTAEYDYWCEFQKTFAENGDISFDQIIREKQDFFNVPDFAKTRANSGLGLLLKQHGIRGYSTAVHTACASGGQALGMALKAIRRGDTDFMLAGGFDSMIDPVGVASFCLLGALSKHNDDPAKACRPFCNTRNGFVLGEGAAFLILETLEHARERGAKIYAEFAGEGNSLSAYRITDSPPDGDGPIQAIRAALKDANESVDRVDYINAHGTGTKMNDLSETNAIKHVFGKRAYDIPVSSIKSQVGHLIAGAGALEGAFCALAIRDSKIPMTANVVEQDAECDLDYVTDGVRAQNIRVAMSNSFGFGGSNSSLLFRAVEDNK